MGVWVVVIFVLSVMRVDGGVPVFVSVAHPVAILSVVFVSDASGDHMAETYSSIFEYLYCLACFSYCDFYVFDVHGECDVVYV